MHTPALTGPLVTGCRCKNVLGAVGTVRRARLVDLYIVQPQSLLFKPPAAVKYICTHLTPNLIISYIQPYFQANIQI